MIIDRAAYDAMVRHMQQAAPQEGCGLLAGLTTCPRDTDGDGNCGRQNCPNCFGTERTCDTWVPMANVAEFPRLRFEIDPGRLLAAWQTLDDQGRRPWIVCHSHPADTTAPSVHDVRLALDETLRHLVVSLRGTFPVADLWRLRPHDPANSMTKIRFQVIDLGFRQVGTSDLTRDVTVD